MIKKYIVIMTLMIVLSVPTFAARHIASDLDGNVVITCYDTKFKDLSFINAGTHVTCESSSKGLVCNSRNIYSTRFHSMDENLINSIIICKNSSLECTNTYN